MLPVDSNRATRLGNEELSLAYVPSVGGDKQTVRIAFFSQLVASQKNRDVIRIPLSTQFSLNIYYIYAE